MFKNLSVSQLPSPILIVAPHPDDDVLSSGGLIQRALKFGKRVYVLYLTVGDANDDAVRKYLHKDLTPKSFIQLGVVRHREAVNAERFLGIPRSRLFFMGFPDAVTLSIVESKSPNRIFQSNYTHYTHADYPFAYQKHAPYNKSAAISIIQSIIKKIMPKTVIVNRFDDTNPDHKAANIFTLHVLREIHLYPKIYSYLIHYPHWPTRTGVFLPPHKLRTKNLRKLVLTEQEFLRTKKAFQFNRSEYIGSPYDRRFVRHVEYFWEET